MSAWTPYLDYLTGQSSSSSSGSRASAIISTLNSKLRTGYRIQLAFDVIHWVSTIALVGYASFVVHKVKQIVSLRHVSPFLFSDSPQNQVRVDAHRVPLQSAILFLVANILNFIRCIWNVAYDATWIVPESVRQIRCT